MNTIPEDDSKIFDTNPRPIILSGLVIIILFFGGLIAWSTLLPYHSAVVANGVVKILQNRKVVQHYEGGIIDKILIREGDTVKAGQVLIQLKDERIEASMSLTQGHLYATIALSARLKAESSLANKIEWPQELLDAGSEHEAHEAINKEGEVFVSRRRDMDGKISLYKTQIEQLRQQREGTQAELQAQQNIISSLENEIVAKKALLKDKYIDKAQILELERRLAVAQGQAGSLVQGIAQGSQRIEELNLRIVDLKNTYRENAISELSKVADQIYQLREQLRPLEDQKIRFDITAPVDGVVMNLKVHSEGSAVIRPGDPLMEIVPKESSLIIEAQIPLVDITQVFKGQHCEVMLPAFDRRTTPRFPGIVEYISADHMVQESVRGTSAFYMTHIKVDDVAITDAGAYLYPGMPATCYITTKERTIMSYLLEPFFKVMDNALLEK